MTSTTRSTYSISGYQKKINQRACPSHRFIHSSFSSIRTPQRIIRYFESSESNQIRLDDVNAVTRTQEKQLPRNGTSSNVIAAFDQKAKIVTVE
jgi:hypothetical protein